MVVLRRKTWNKGGATNRESPRVPCGAGWKVASRGSECIEPRKDATMIRVKIGDEIRQFDGRPQWVREQLEGRQREGRHVCVRVFIKCDGIDVVLSTHGCDTDVGTPRPLRPAEREIFERWAHHRLDSSDFRLGELIAFL